MDFTKYDILLFGVTGFTGKLAVEYLWKKSQSNSDHKELKWGVCARNAEKAKLVLEEIAKTCSLDVAAMPTIEVADLMCDSEDRLEKLRKVVLKTKVVLTTAGPFEKYGTSLVQLCAEHGVHYGDVTGESDFFRWCIDHYDSVAQENKATIICHCGNDCIPQDISVYEMHQFAKSQNCTLKQVVTYVDGHSSNALSGGTVTTAVFQLGKKNRYDNAKLDFDPLMKNTLGDNKKSEFTTKILFRKESTTFQQDDGPKRTASPYVMSPVMSNCIRRSNALLGYNTQLEYGDLFLQNASTWDNIKGAIFQSIVAVAIILPFQLPYLLPKPGEGPSRDTMENGFLNIYARGIIVDTDGNEIPIAGTLSFPKDVFYLMTAQMLVEVGMLLATKDKVPSGCLTPIAAFGGTLKDRLESHLGVSWRLDKQ